MEKQDSMIFRRRTLHRKKKKNLTNLTETNIFSHGELSHGEVSHGKKSLHGYLLPVFRRVELVKKRS